MSQSTEDDSLRQIAPGVAVSGPGWREVVYEGNPREEDYLAAQKVVCALRSELASIRHRLEQMQRIETNYAHDSRALRAAGAVHCAIVALAGLQMGDSSFAVRAERSKEKWEDVAARPERYVVEPGPRKDPCHYGRHQEEWDWRDWNWTAAPKCEEVYEAARAVVEARKNADADTAFLANPAIQRLGEAIK